MFSGIQEAVVHKRDVFLLFEGQIQKLELLPVGKVVTQLFNMQSYSLCATVAAAFSDTLLTPSSRLYVPPSLLTDLKERMEQENEVELAQRIDNVVKSVVDSEMSLPSGGSTVSFNKLQSGIYVLRQRSVSEVLAEAEQRQQRFSTNDTDQELAHSMPEDAELCRNSSTEVCTADEEVLCDGERAAVEGCDTNTETEDHDQDVRISRESTLSSYDSSESLVSVTSLSSNECTLGESAVGEYFQT